MKKTKLYIDMDGVLCDFMRSYEKSLKETPEQTYPQAQWGFFLKLREIPMAIESLKKLREKYDVWILTRPSFKNVNSFSEKAQWIWDHIDFEQLEKTILCGDKSLLKGEFLIDDDTQHGQTEFEGEHIHFGTDKFPDWETVTDYLM